MGIQLTEFRWGIISTGKIAACFVKDLLVDPKTRNVHDVVHRVAAVGSRSVEKAQEFIDSEAGGDKSIKAYGSYAEVYADKNALDAIKAGKNVLCEKPVTCNVAELRSLLLAAKEHDVFFMEAVWTRFQPLTLEVKRIAEEGSLGAPVVLHADLSGDFDVQNIPKTHRILDPALGGGALLDLGPYPLVWAIVALYENPLNKLSNPSNISGTMLKTPLTNVDSNTSFTVTFAAAELAAQAILSCSINLNPQQPGVNIRFERGTITIPAPIYCPKEFTVRYYGKNGQVTREARQVFEYTGGGWHFQADEVARCVRDGKKESALWGHNKSLLEMEIFDEMVFDLTEAGSRSLCIFYRMGQCQNGDDCSFAHSSDDDQQLSSDTVASSQSGHDIRPLLENSESEDIPEWAIDTNQESSEHDGASPISLLKSDEVDSSLVPPHDQSTPDQFNQSLIPPDDQLTSEETDSSSSRDPSSSPNYGDHTIKPESDLDWQGKEKELDGDIDEFFSEEEAPVHETIGYDISNPHVVTSGMTTTSPLPRSSEESHVELLDEFHVPSEAQTIIAEIVPPPDDLNNASVEEVSWDQEHLQDSWNHPGSHQIEDSVLRYPDAAFVEAHEDYPEYPSSDANEILPDPEPLPPADIIPHWSEYADPSVNTMIPFCKFLTQARCNQGFACRFRHSLSVKEYEILFRDPYPTLWSHLDQFQTDGSTQPATKNSFTTCKFYPLGKCRNGTSCPYLHTLSTAKPMDTELSSQLPEEPDYPTSALEHNRELQNRDNKPPCKWFQQGNCRYGDKCNFLHDIVQENEEVPGYNPAEERSIPLDNPMEEEPPAMADDGWSTNAEGWGTYVDGWVVKETVDNGDKTVHAKEDQVGNKSPTNGGWSAGDTGNWSPAGEDPWAILKDNHVQNELPTTGGRSTEETSTWSMVKESPFNTSTKSNRCIYYARGLCRRGDKCNLTHDNPKSNTSRSASPNPANGFSKTSTRPQTIARQDQSTSWALQGDTNLDTPSPVTDERRYSERGRPQCKFHLSGHCKNGILCNFSHDTPGPTDRRMSRAEPPVKETWSKDSTHDSWVPPQTCSYHAKGRCKRGSQCKLSHSSPQGGTSRSSRSGNSTPSRVTLPPPSLDNSPAQDLKRSSQCAYHIKGYCKRGTQCTFGHDSPNGGTPISARSRNSTPGLSPFPGPPSHHTSSKKHFYDDPELIDVQEDQTPWDAAQDTTEPIAPDGAGGWPDTESENEYSPWTAPQNSICEFHLQGHCRKGKRCGMRHESPVPASSNQEKNSVKPAVEQTNETDPVSEWAAETDLPPMLQGEPSLDEGSWVNQEGLLDEPHGSDSDPEWHEAAAPPPNEDDEATWKEEWPQEPAQPLGPTKILAPCKAFGQGYCPLGDSCLFLHIIEEDVVVETPSFAVVEDRNVVDESLHVDGDEGLVANGTNTDATDIEQEQDSEEEQEEEQEPEIIAERDMFNCRIRFGLDNGCSPTDITTASESCRILVCNLPSNISQPDVVDLVLTIDDLEFPHEDIILEYTGTDAADVMIKFATPKDALKAVIKLHGQTYDSRPLATRLVTEILATPLECSTVKITWPSPTCIVWVFYPTITIAKEHEKRLNGLLFRGRKVKASFSRPSSNARLYAVMLSNMLPNLDKAAIEELSKSSVVHLHDATYTGNPLDDIHNVVAARGPLARFHRLPLDPTHTKHITFARFDNAAALEGVLQAHGVQQPFLGGGTLSLQKVFHKNYMISMRRYQALRGVLEQLRARFEEEKHCTLRIYDAAEPVDIHLYADAGEGTAFGTANREVQAALAGEVLLNREGKNAGTTPLWHEVFDMAQGTEAVTLINAKDPNYFVKVDQRKQVLRVSGEADARARAERAVLKLLKQVCAQRQVLPLGLPELWAMVDGLYKTLQDTLGADKVILDVNAPELVVWGVKHVQKVKEELALAVSSNRFPTHKSDSTGHLDTCTLCLRSPRGPDPPITLPCDHAYCTSCLRHVLHRSAGLQFVPPACIATTDDGGVCGTFAPYVVVRDLLPMTAEAALLRGAFLAHVRAQSGGPEMGQFFFCPTPHCETVHRALAAERVTGPSVSVVYTCPTCTVPVCAACCGDEHEGLPCPVPGTS
ncbi:hypothetical protein H0H81_007031 [Sphagnurus paluster]|uniref:D-xylose 1-dehydrogenase (NADP(+), D-xylono-1,5-lactone-forming) n=1 Tax=Sphagnurus paluster TaxID=117069 RepID=A0A9P7G234_9AGAR|nr:hypothetical protein H0H81_007031 [Sphagnurus paluster]